MKNQAMKAGLMLLLAGWLSAAWSAGLAPLDDVQMAGVSGREGVALDFDYGMNVFKVDTTYGGKNYKRGDPLPRALLEDNASLTDPTATIFGRNGCVTLGAGVPGDCTLAIATNNRPGLWVILKDMWAILKMHDFWVDGGKVSVVSGQYKLTLPGSSTFTTPFDLSNANADETRFYESSKPVGSRCLLAGKTEGSCNMSGLPLLVMQYDPLNKANNKPDVTWHLHIGRVAMQGKTDNSGTPAYMLDQPGSFMSYQVSDFNHNEANIHYGGRVLMFGF